MIRVLKKLFGCQYSKQVEIFLKLKRESSDFYTAQVSLKSSSLLYLEIKSILPSEVKSSTLKSCSNDISLNGKPASTYLESSGIKSSIKHEMVSTSHKKQLGFFNYEHDIPHVSSKKDLKFVIKEYNKKRMIHLKKRKLHRAITSSAKYFDICSSGKTISDMDKPVPNSLYFEEENECSSQPRNRVIRNGMVLLKNYLTSTQQVEIVKQCRDFGLGPGGFYRPGYKHGGKLNLHMMCLGLSWDPQARTYTKIHPLDKSETPEIPESFYGLVKDSISFSQDIIKATEDSIPDLDPDICIVNFYETTGKLGLHQDRDESEKSLEKGLPVVSFSIGDSADFLFGDERDVSKAENIELESGDVLIFGGESRHVFHGVSSIIPNTAPEFLCKEAHLHPGRLNLTFRQY